jgi:hypothetical protein
MLQLRQLLILTIPGLFFTMGLMAQPSTFVDEHGVMRWTETEEEVCAFGTNYSEPFSSWQEHELLGVKHEKAIDADIYHLARMGLDGYRIHVWETYICDYDGNLLFNKHLQLFDYLLFKLKERDIKIFITPINFYGGSPSGFHNKFGGKKGCLTDTTSFPAQENYLAQFVSHVNPYTGIAYKDDPDIIGFEINNEPFNHSDRPDLTTQYIDRMGDAIRGTGCEKPIFYNVSHNIDQIDNFCAADIVGGTFQWYPTGLVANHDQKGNILPNVDQYIVPFADHPRFKNMAKISYELSPADVARSSHLYPVMARSFRESGFQFAAQFAYSPMATAYANVRWQTHYVSLPYAPKKSMGMAIATEVFHRVPLGKSYGRYPENTTFDAFRVSYEDDLAEMVTDKQFLHTNHTSTLPPRLEKLERVSGTGSSPVVSYEGTGVYFLDKLDDGVWRLEVMPDVIWVGDPHFSTALDKEVSVVQWREWPMVLNLPDLGEGFTIEGLNEGNEVNISANGETFSISPGSYLLTRKDKISDWDGNDTFKNIRLDEFHAPESHCMKTYVVHEPPQEISAGSKISLTAKIVSPEGPEKVELILVRPGSNKAITMIETQAYQYTAEVPSEYLESAGILRYYITLGNGEKYETFPSGFEGNHPLDRKIGRANSNILPAEPWQIRIMNVNDPVCLFDADDDWEQITKTYQNSSLPLLPSYTTGKSMVHFNTGGLSGQYHDYTNRSYCRSRIESRKDDLKSKNELIVIGSALNGKPCKLQVALIMKDATVYGGIITLDPEDNQYEVSLKDFKPVKMRLLPREIPGFQPYYFESAITSKFDLSEVESLQISIGPGIPESEYDEQHGVAIGRILLR